jgi:superfamily II DNA or RNA helicase
MIQFSRTDLERLFPEKTWALAENLVAEGAVIDVAVERDGRSVTGKVKGDRRTPYLTRVKIQNGRGGRVRLSSTCTCLVYSECEHAAAALLGLLEQSAAPDSEEATAAIGAEVESWIAAVNAAAKVETTGRSASSGDAVIYLLEPTQRSWRDLGSAQPVVVNVVRGKRLRGGGYGKVSTYAVSNIVGDDPPPFVTEQDQVIGRLLGTTNGRSKRLSNSADAQLLRLMIATGRCHWRNAEGSPFKMGSPRTGKFAWRFDSEGQQHVVCEVEDAREGLLILALGEPWYIDTNDNTIGTVQTELPGKLAPLMLRSPSIPATAAMVVRQRLQPSSTFIPLPEPLRKRERLEIRPTPQLHLHCPVVTTSRGMGWNREEADVDLPLARISFDYAGAKVSWQDGRTELNHVKNNRLFVLPRDALAEVQMIERLNAVGLQPLGPTGLGRFADELARQDFTFEEDDDDDVSMRWVEFNHYEVPKLAEEGWQITFSEEYPYQVVNEVPAWTIDVNESSNDWFELDLGIDVDGGRVPLLPVLVDLFNRAPEEMTPEALAEYGDDQMVYANLADGRLLPIPATRLQSILEALYEMFEGGHLDGKTSITMGKAELPKLATLETMLPKDEISWNGGEGIRKMAAHLASSRGIPKLPAPRDIKAKLRPYQQQGLEWLQFIGQCGLSGVLADDMGLGKTIQTLSHIVTEKAEGRLERPCLIVAPTSLIPTWRRETRKFAPSLRILVLHGNDRHERFERIGDNDLVLTSYALMLRDKDALMRHHFRIMVLDEAQAIKNPTTKIARAACQINADVRLALSGTPMENHLGELWSVFHFLMPGFLGDRETFRRVFRTQIEKEGDAQRKELLANRVRPFLLRRTKEEVAAELPPKSEFIREIELTDEQRDLYETVRISMHEKVREEIRSRGIARSNVAILEALLKLRQVCCDPRLLKKMNGTAPPPSAKFDILMDMVSGMVETGRKIIIFSQFVGMLDLIEAGLQRNDIDFVKLTGRTKDRETPVDMFQSGKVPVFLISLKAGGVGLTLTRADTVIHYDPWWNPAVEAQATDRAHRIGQDKTVFVYKLIASGTVEEKMVELQGKKKALVDGILGDSGTGSMSFSEADVESLFAPLEA